MENSSKIEKIKSAKQRKLFFDFVQSDEKRYPALAV